VAQKLKATERFLPAHLLCLMFQVAETSADWTVYGTFSGTLALAEAAHFGQVTATLHIAPLTSAVFADVQKQPAAVFSGASAQARQVIRGQHLGGRIGDPPEHLIHRVLRVRPLPDEILLADAQPDSAMRDIQLLVEQIEVVSARARAVNDGGANAIDRPAQGGGAPERRGGLFLAPPGFTRERLRFVGADQIRMQAPSQQIKVIIQLLCSLGRLQSVVMISRA